MKGRSTMTFNTKVEIIGLYKLTLWKSNDSYIISVDNSLQDCFRPLSMNLYDTHDEQDASENFKNIVALYRKKAIKEKDGKFLFQRSY